ncbi:hypothetical protein CEUSTIGMA_g5605.t1 [Chlamydomonas eustigma]|uniref:Uncharacterized protein n=1 Tax=Chlamydomonas eustigma TaxID=1157962 RepID=A0A250X511_9CHLO|nr:hypothetical protein CEUSTIGMA_g5605.t1 [Chlamydomonas eustigma]|eukprot:GAX78163.1 hypothetical protein CEUSTIGMA_g5605.t1 [Chlamydomonas eustigma]
MRVGSALAASYSANSIVYFILAASVVELIAAALNCQGLTLQASYNLCTNSFNAWAVAVGTISTAFTFIFAIMTLVANNMAEKMAPVLSIFLVLLWIPGAFVTTFNGPFLNTGNGYYASWAAFLFSVVFMQQVGILQLGARDYETTVNKSSSAAAESQAGRMTVPISGANHDQHLFSNSAAV